MKISVYVTSYNQKTFLGEAIESILDQTLKPHQIIIVDDDSTDGSQELISAYVKSYPNLITPVYHSQNTGVAQVRIDALHAVTGDYVTYVDGDDRFLPEKLEKEFKLLQANPHAQIAFSNFFFMDEDGGRSGCWVEGVKPPEGNVFRQTFAREFPKGMLFRKELVNYHFWKQVGFYDSLLDLYEDFDMRIRLTKHLQVVYQDEPLSEYRLHSMGLSRAEFIYHVQALKYIYNKNKWLLDDLSPMERHNAKQKLGEFIGQVAYLASVEAHQENRHLQSLRLLLTVGRFSPSSFDWRLFAQLLLPKTVWKNFLRVKKGLIPFL